MSLPRTYESFLEEAKARSMGGRYSAVVEITHYRQASSRMTVMAGPARLASGQRGSAFVGVAAQFFDGKPVG